MSSNIQKQYKPLLTHNDIEILPALYSTENQDNPMVMVHIYNYYGSQFWLLLEYNPIDKIAFAYCDLCFGQGELGYVSIVELESLSITNCFIDINRKFIPDVISKSIDYAKKFNEQRFGNDFCS
jgi:hypothetical protein